MCGWNVQRARKTNHQLKFFPYAYVGLIFLIFVRLMIVADASVVWASLCLRCLGGNWVLVPSKLRSGVFRANGNGC